jgi:CRISPR-associated protein (TIGR03986 family)
MQGYNYNNNNSNRRTQPHTINEDFYNPYSFIPLSNVVFNLPDEDIAALEQAQDMPFSDGIDGYIEATFKAMTPFCLRSSDSRNVKVDNNFIMPGSSVKGMLRNVLEIISLSNIRANMANDRYSMRDLNSPNYTLKSSQKPKSGFLIQVKGKFWIIPCKSVKVSFKDIIEDDGADFNDKNIQSVKEKYAALQCDRIVEYDGDENLYMWFFSGFMNNKNHEYLFTIPQLSESDAIPLEEDEYNDFIFIHEKENKNKNWAFWKENLKNYSSFQEIEQDWFKGIVPCFFRTKNDENSKTIVRDLGFSYLYRQPYDKRLYDCLPNVYKKDTFDLAQAVFGFVKGNHALRGRGQVMNSVISNANQLNEQTLVLGSPKPTYYPFYLQQDKRGDLNNYFTTGAVIAGWKRFLVHDKLEMSHVNVKNHKVGSSFIPIDKDATFTVRINVHNLRHYEVGALIAALSFLNHPECFHSLGYAKPFGYGKFHVENIDISHLAKINGNDDAIVSKDFFINSFKSKLLSATKLTESQWLSFINPLFLLASGKYKGKRIRYPNLDNREFETIKRERKNLNDFSPLK